MSQQNPSPRAAASAFVGGPLNQAVINALTPLAAAPGSPWDAEDSILAFRDMPVADRPAWLALETTLAGMSDPEAALSALELSAGSPTQGPPVSPPGGSHADVIACWNAHTLTAASRRVRVRALSRVISCSEFPTVVLASLQAELDGMES